MDRYDNAKKHILVCIKKYSMQDLILEEFLDRGIKESTQKRDKAILEQYLSHVQKISKDNTLTFDDILSQAEDDKDNTTRERKWRITLYLKSYHKFLDKESNYSLSTAIRHFSTVKTFYEYYRITVPKTKKKWTIKANIETIDDIPKKDDILKALNIASLKNKAIITLMATSGMDSIATRNLKLIDLIYGVQDYIEYDITNFNIHDFIKTCRKHDDNDIIPYWEGIRQKTERYVLKFYTFSSPESFTSILDYIEYPLARAAAKPMGPEDYLFPGHKGRMSPQNMQDIYADVNDRLGLGWVGKHRFFHSHAMRKFFANTLEDVDIGSRSFDHMMGHSPGKVKDAYIKPKKDRLLVQYKKALPELLMEKVIVQDRTPAQIKEIVRENQDIRAKQEEINKEFKKILEYATKDPDGFADFLKNMNKKK